MRNRDGKNSKLNIQDNKRNTDPKKKKIKNKKNMTFYLTTK